MRIGFIGIGLMGRPMVENLLQAGYELVLWNRTRAKAEHFSGRAQVAGSVRELVKTCDLVITMLETGDVVEQLILEESVLAEFSPGQVFVDMSSIPPAQARKIAAALGERGAEALDAPVSGGTVGAETASLSIMAGGPESAFGKIEAILARLGTPRYMGPSGTGQLAKLANQSIVGVTIGAVAEALLLARAGGADLAAVREALLGGFAQSRILDLHGLRMIERAFEPGARSRVQLKDMNMILAEADSLGLDLPLAAQTRGLYRELVQAGFEGLDHSALLLAIEGRNQLDIPEEGETPC